MRRGVEAYYLAEHAAGRPVLRTPEDADSLVDALVAAPASRNLAELHSLDRPLLPSGFPDHELLVGVDGNLGVGVLEFMDARGNFVSFNPEGGRKDIVYAIAGNLTEFPDSSEIAVELVRQAIKEFLDSGGLRPECVQWKEPDFW